MSTGVSMMGIVVIVIGVIVIGAVAAALIHAFSSNKNRDDG